MKKSRHTSFYSIKKGVKKIRYFIRVFETGKKSATFFFLESHCKILPKNAVKFAKTFTTPINTPNTDFLITGL